jgi:exonuclease SbcC
MSIKEGERFQSLVSGDKHVTMEVQNLLEMDGDLFLNAVYVRQGEISDLIEKTSSEKKQMIGRLLGIDSLEKAWKNIKIILDKYNGQKLRLEGKLESFEDANVELDSKKEQEEQFKIKIKDLNREIEEKIIDTNLTREKKEILDKRSLESEKNQTLLNSKEHFMEQLEKTKKDLNWQLTEITGKEEEISKLKLKLNKLDVLKSLEEKIKELKNLTKTKKD